MERTLILLKPDAITQKICGKVITRFEEAGFTIRACKMIQLTPDVLREHYAHIADLPFYPDVEEFMGSTPVLAMVIEGKGVIDSVRDMLGVTDSAEAAPGTLREEYGSKEGSKSKMINVAHASDSRENAEEEVKRFFSEDELFDY